MEAEKGNIYKMNILIGTPGRLLQHFSETAYFNCDNLKMLVIDEADRILDDGFKDTLAEIFSYLPASRTTLLFSATITKSLKSLVKVNLKTPEYITIHNIDSVLSENNNESKELISINNLNNSNDVTPINLVQYYSFIEPHEKVDTLYSFLNSHPTTKCIVFLSSTKQVRYFYEIFKKLKLKFNFFELYGRQKQEKRTYIFYNFLKKNNSVLFATDIASRGIDFPLVDWVIQLDCPEDLATYIHRVGRTARYKSKGNSLLFVSQGESKFVDELSIKKINVKKIKINPSKIVSLKPILRSILSENPSILHLAKKAISSYIKSVHLNSNKSFFDIKNINIEELALSFGLMMTPELTIVKKSQNNLKNALKIQKEDENKPVKKLSKLQKLKEKIKLKKIQKTEILNNENAESNNKIEAEVSSDEEDNDEDVQYNSEDDNNFLKIKRKNVDLIEDTIHKDNMEEREYQFEHKNPYKDEVGKENFVDKVRSKLEKNKGESKIIQKQRIIEKHKYDRMRSKVKDYEKHHFSKDADSNEPIPILKELRIVNEQTSKASNKLDFNEIQNSTIENKSKLALKLIMEKGLLK